MQSEEWAAQGVEWQVSPLSSCHPAGHHCSSPRSTSVSHPSNSEPWKYCNGCARYFSRCHRWFQSPSLQARAALGLAIWPGKDDRNGKRAELWEITRVSMPSYSPDQQLLASHCKHNIFCPYDAPVSELGRLREWKKMYVTCYCMLLWPNLVLIIE